ncbi:MAG: ATP-binding cassette domain-containing protein [Betaproteobacteria bacterium]
MVSWPDCWLSNQLIVRAGSLVLDSAVTVISGHSGAGKTTLMRCICRYNSSLNPRLVFQEPTLLPWLSVKENLRIVCEDERLHAQWLDLFDLPSVSGLRPGQLSLGMQRRIAIIRGILARPGLLLLDEPSASLDHENVERLIANIQVASAESRVPIIVVTHNPVDFAKLNPSYFELKGNPAEIREMKN